MGCNSLNPNPFLYSRANFVSCPKLDTTFRADEDMIDICGKLQVLDQMIDELLARKHKILIFSQMTRMLDIIGDYLGQVKEVRFSRLDGSMSFEDRQENIDVFNETDDVQGGWLTDQEQM